MNANLMLTTSALILSTACATAETSTRIDMGDGQVNGMTIAPYEYVWSQCNFSENSWVRAAPLTEEVVLIGDEMLRLRQTTGAQSARKTIFTAYMDRASLSPQRMEIEVATPDGGGDAAAIRDIHEDGYTGVTKRNGQQTPASGIISSQMFHGGALGLVLRTLDFSRASYTFDASMMTMNATYVVDATLAGKETIEFNNDVIDILLIDVHWVHNENGDIYPPGPDASGGRYWIAENPPENFPHVPRYKTDNYVVEFVPEFCPAEEQ